MKTKRFLVILMVLVLGLSLCACKKAYNCVDCNNTGKIYCDLCDSDGKEHCDCEGGYVACEVCDGWGFVSDGMNCPKCKASGKITNPITWQSFECGNCDGDGKVPADCKNCDGKGHFSEICPLCNGTEYATCQNCDGTKQRDCLNYECPYTDND